MCYTEDLNLRCAFYLGNAAALFDWCQHVCTRYWILHTRYSTSIEHRTSSIERASIISDKSRINRVMDSLEIKAGLDGKHLVEDNASLSFYWQQLVDRAEATLDSKEKKEALEVIRAMQIITSLPPEFRASRKRLTSYFTVL